MIQEKSDEISFGELFLKTGSFIRYLLSKWLVMLVAGIIGGAIGLLIALNLKPTYTGKLTFVLSTGYKEMSFSTYASQLGLDMGSGGNDVFSGDNILNLFQSERMVKAVLFKKPPASNDILANIIVKEWEWDEKWRKKERTKDQFPFPLDAAKLTLIQDSLIREVYTTILEKNLNVIRLDRKLSVYEISTKSTSEIFSCYLTLYLMDETAKFYIDTKTSLAKLNLRMLQQEADSLRGVLGGAISSTAAEVDRTFALNPALQVQRAPAQKSQIRASVLTTTYGEVVKNLELAKINLQKETPLYQIIDKPQMPLKVKKVSKTIYTLLGAIISLFVCIGILLFLKIVRK